MKSLREKIEAAKVAALEVDVASTRAKTAEERAARRVAKLKAKEILKQLPARIAERVAKGFCNGIVACGIGYIRTVDELRGRLDHPGSYVVEALLEEGYVPEVSLDCSGAHRTNHSLVFDYWPAAASLSLRYVSLKTHCGSCPSSISPRPRAPMCRSNALMYGPKSFNESPQATHLIEYAVWPIPWGR